MRLRIISGTLKGRFITVPDSGHFRPTSERTRESLAEIIKSRLPQANVADVCAGSGAMGFEMISRGALHVDLIESDRRRAELLKKNASALGIAEQCRIFTKSVKDFLDRSTERYDLIFFDPPYDDEDLKNMILPLRLLLTDSGILLYESRKPRKSKDTASEKTADSPLDCRFFGDTMVQFFGRDLSGN